MPPSIDIQENLMQSEEPSKKPSIDLLYKLKKSLTRQWKPAIAVFVGVIAVTAVIALTRKPIYSAEGKLFFRREATTPALTGFGKDVGSISSLREQASPVDTQVEVLRSHKIVTKTITLLNLKDAKGKTVLLKDFMKDLKVNITKGTDLIQISYEDRDPIVAAQVVNTLIQVYLDFAAERYRLITSNARQFVEKEIPSAKEKVKEAELKLRGLRETNNIVSLEEEQRSSVLFLFNVQNEIKTVQAQLADTESQFLALKNKTRLTPDQAVSTTNITQSKGVQDILAEKQKLESQLALESTRYQGSHPVIQALRSQLDAAKKLLMERIDLVQNNQIEGLVESSSQLPSLRKDLSAQLVQLEIKRIGLVNQLRSLLESEDQAKLRIDILPKLEKEQRELLRDLNTAQQTYTNLTTKADELRLAENQNTGNASILSEALVPPKPSSPSVLLFMMAGILFGGLSAIATAIFLDSKDKRIQNTEDVMQVYNFPVLGEIPMRDSLQVIAFAVEKTIPPTDAKLSEKDRNSLMCDVSQILGLNLKVLNIKTSIKVITVTSVEEQEGKSTIAAYLATSLAHLGEKVVLVDANLHSHSKHRLLGQFGLTDVLLDSVELDLALEQSIPNLSLLSSGSLSPLHSLAMLDTPKMETIIRKLSSIYDYVILDTSAIRSNPDALFLNKFSDGILLVVRPNISTLDSAAYLKKSLAHSGQTVFAQVINGVKWKAEVESTIEVKA